MANNIDLEALTLEELLFPILTEEEEPDGKVKEVGIVIPDIECIEDTSYLKSKDITEAITQKVVKTALLETSDSLVYPSYMIDFSGITLIQQCVLEGIKSMIVSDGDTGIYIMNSHGDMILAGMGRKQELYRILEPYIESIFGDNAKIYINKGAGFKKIKKLAVDSVILDI